MPDQFEASPYCRDLASTLHALARNVADIRAKLLSEAPEPERHVFHLGEFVRVTRYRLDVPVGAFGQIENIHVAYGQPTTYGVRFTWTDVDKEGHATTFAELPAIALAPAESGKLLANRRGAQYVRGGPDYSGQYRLDEVPDRGSHARAQQEDEPHALGGLMLSVVAGPLAAKGVTFALGSYGAVPDGIPPERVRFPFFAHVGEQRKDFSRFVDAVDWWLAEGGKVLEDGK